MNITEFAKVAGVSKSAVSRYFNKGYLSEEKYRKIERAIEETGYMPSTSAQNVRTKITKLVGVIIPKLSSESCSRVVEGISLVLNEHGYQLLLVNTANDPQKEIEYLELFRSNRVDAVIFLASVFTSRHRSMLRKMHIPVIVVGQEFEGLSCVYHDDFGAAYALTDLMLKKGAQRPACICAEEHDAAAGAARKNGYIQALKDNGKEFDGRYFARAEFSIESGYIQAQRLLSRYPAPDCIFCATDSMAIGAMMYCREHGIKIPEQLMLCAVGDSKMGSVSAVPLTSAHLHYKTSGIDAAEMLLAALRKNDEIPRSEKLGFSIIERESTARN